jgi:hypothetical protein
MKGKEETFLGLVKFMFSNEKTVTGLTARQISFSLIFAFVFGLYLNIAGFII